MVSLKIDQWPLDILSGFCVPVEIYDATGTKLLGTFTPVDVERGQRLYAEIIARTDYEELARQAAEPGLRRLHCEIIKELNQRYSRDAPPEPPPADSAVQPGSSECVAP
jgi:hypothetical protein